METFHKRTNKIKVLIVHGPPRHGKLIADHIPVLTINGWKTHGEIKVGDYVFSPYGKAIKVLALSSPGKADYKVEFTNGEIIYCHGNHEWTVIEHRRTWKTLETAHMKPPYKERCRYQVQDIECLEFPSRKHLLHPYALGAWLGDGSTTKPCITHAKEDQAIINKISSLGYTISAKWIHKITGVCMTSFGGKVGVGGKFWNALKSINVNKGKFIPDNYKYTNKNDRLELMAGLIDTDGHVEKETGRVRIVTVSLMLAEDIKDVAMSLGWRPYITMQKPIISTSGIIGRQNVYTVGFQPTCKIPVALKRKEIKCHALRRKIGIKSISVDSRGYKGKCIQVDSKDGLYLVGKTLIPTHNSEQFPIHAPPFLLGNFPKLKIIITAYAATLAENHSSKGRDIFQKWGPILWNTHPSKKVFSRGLWQTEEGGEVLAVGMEGGASGFGADVLFIDDYHKTRKQAESLGERESNWTWWESVAGTRIHPGGVVFLFATRWHDDDLVGRILAQHKELGDDSPYDLQHIVLTALAKENDILGREPGEALWPWRYNEERLNHIKKMVGPYEWAALFDGDPVAIGGNLFKTEDFRYYTIDKMTSDILCWRKDIEEPLRLKSRELIRHVYVDPAIEIKTSNDPTGMAAWGYSRKERVWVLLDRINERIEHQKIMGRIKLFAFKNRCTSIGIENEKLGKVLVKQSAGNDSVGGVKIPFKEIPTEGLDKYARATPMATYFQNERVFIHRDAPYKAKYETSLVKFPNAAHDEDVDITAMAQHMEQNLTLAEIMAGKC